MTWRVVGALLLVCGLALGGAVGWQVWGTVGAAAAAQQAAANTLTRQWDTDVPQSTAALPGGPVARLSIPRIAGQWTMVEGVGERELAIGPGRYPGTADPGQVGNLAIAGHRVTHGAPFYRLDELQVCDEIVVTGRDDAYTYRVLPQPGELAPCALPDVGLPGSRIVGPERGDLVLPVPAAPGATPTHALLTLTTCHPRYSAAERLIVHAVLVGRDGDSAQAAEHRG